MLVLVGSLGELLGRPEGGGRGLVHRPPVDLQETAGLLQQVTAGELVTQLVGGTSRVSDGPSHVHGHWSIH